ncbi:MAG: hypothetical protein NTV49_05975 [Kiritimatiellaeota bacterium]|nr:hypothetical protein [Kiritimatiellota bacterium]
MVTQRHDARRWFRLTQIAQQEVEAMLVVLPREVHDRLSELPITS